VKLFFVGGIVLAFAKFVGDGNFGVIDTFDDPVLVINLRENFEGFLRHWFAKVGGVVKDAKKRSIVFDSKNIARRVGKATADIDTKISVSLDNILVINIVLKDFVGFIIRIYNHPTD